MSASADMFNNLEISDSSKLWGTHCSSMNVIFIIPDLVVTQSWKVIQ